MKIRQLSLFLENRPGQLRVPCQVLGDAGHQHPHAVARRHPAVRHPAADRAGLGEGASRCSRRPGFVVNVTEVLAVEVPDRPGGLADVLESFEKAGLGIEYMYAFAAARERGKYATLVFRLEDPDRAGEAPRARQGVKLALRARSSSRAARAPEGSRR